MDASEGDLLSRGYGAVLWEPDDKTVRHARITRFMSWLEAHDKLHPGGYEDLWQWSVSEPGEFWTAIWDYFELLRYFGRFQGGADSPRLRKETSPSQWGGRVLAGPK